MSDPKRATLITVGAPKSVKNNVNKTVRLTVNLEESNESKYPELNYKELVIAEEKSKKLENGKTSGLDPFSDNDDDVERVARKFEQKYGNNSTYGKKRRTKRDDFADIGAGYDENDSFIDNTDGYDEMIPPECDTLYGGFYINCGSLEFKTVPENAVMSEDEQVGGRRNKRRISSSSSDEESSESSSESESQDEKEKVVNGNVDSHNTEHRKKKNKKIDKKKAKKKQRTDSSAATSGKQTSDDHGDAESADSRTSQSDSLTSKPAPSSENAITSDSSRDVEAKQEVKLPQAVNTVLEELEASVTKYQTDHPGTTARDMGAKADPYIARLERTMNSNKCVNRIRRVVWTRAARSLALPRTKLLHRVKALTDSHADNNTHQAPNTSAIAQTTATSTVVSTTLSTKTTTTTSTTKTTTATSTTKTTVVPIAKSVSNPVVSSKSVSNPAMLVKSNSTTTTNNNKRKHEDNDKQDFSKYTKEQREAEIGKTLERLKQLIEERTPSMIANYNAECERVQEERKKLQIASGEGGPHIEKRLPKRRFPWCNRSRGLLSRLRNLAGDKDSAAALLSQRVLPLFPTGFVRMPTLLKQTDLKDVKLSETKRPRINSTTSLPATQAQPGFAEPSLHFPSSLTVTTHMKSPEKDVEMKDPKKTALGTIFNSFSVKDEDRKQIEMKEDLYIPPNNLGSITITPVPNNPTKEKKINNNVAIEKHKEPLIRVKSPAALNEMVNKDAHKKKVEKQIKDKRDNVKDVPLYIDTNCQPQKKDPSPKNKEDAAVKQIENMKKCEDNIPRPVLVPVHHSPTFVKPDKRPPEIKKKKDILIVSDLDPLSEAEPLAVDDSSSDVEVVEEKTTLKSDNNKKDGVVSKSDKKSDTVPSVDKSVVRSNSKDSVNKSVNKELPQVKRIDVSDDKNAFDAVMRNLMQMEANSQSPPDKKSNSNNFKNVITSARHEQSSNSLFDARDETSKDKDKLTTFFEQNGWM